MKKTIILIIVLIAVAGFYYWDDLKNIWQTESSPTITFGPSNSVDNKSDRIRVRNVKSGDVIRSPLTIKGEARGYWFFEASFPVKLFDSNGKQIAVTIAQAQDEWTTIEFVPFETVLTFPTPVTSNGTLIFEKDNPSGLPEHADELRIQVRFDTAVTSKPCVVTGCSGQICSDEEVITTCEYRAEYACYKTARCERQPNGKCGWKETQQLQECLAKFD